MKNKIKIRFRRKSVETCQILNKKIYNASHFELKILQRVRFAIKIFTTRQILKKKKFFKKHDFEEKRIFKKHDFEEKIIFKKHNFEEEKIFKKQTLEKFLHTKKSGFVSVYPVKCANFAFYVHF